MPNLKRNQNTLHGLCGGVGVAAGRAVISGILIYAAFVSENWQTKMNCLGLGSQAGKEKLKIKYQKFVLNKVEGLKTPARPDIHRDESGRQIKN